MAEDPRITFFTRQGCHLCEEARAVIERVCADTGERFEAIDIDADEGLQQRYGEHVPVTLVDGRQHDFWRVEEGRLREALARAPRSSRAAGPPRWGR